MTDERIIAYLLEELPEDDLEQFEYECFAQESWPSEINLVEEDLIDAYLRNELSPERRQRFEQNYLITDARQKRVLMAAALLRQVDERQAASEVPKAALPSELTWAERVSGFWRSLTLTGQAVTALALVAVITGALWLLFIRAPSPQTFATLTLSISSTTRAEGAPTSRVKLPPDVGALQVALILPPQSPVAARYRVELENDRGEQKAVEIKGLDAQAVVVVIETAQLKREPYALRLFAIKPDGSEQRIPGNYFFQVE
jgi:hypothetical protein